MKQANLEWLIKVLYEAEFEVKSIEEVPRTGKVKTEHGMEWGKAILIECRLQQWPRYGYAMLLNVFILALMCSITTRLPASLLLYAFSRLLSWCFLLTFIGMKLFEWY